jgi:hypothetical protein
MSSWDWQPTPTGRWFKSVGAKDWPMDENWLDTHPNETEIIHFAKRPKAVRVDDTLVYYAAVHQKIFGIVKVFSKPQDDPTRTRWPWWAYVRPQVIIRSFERAPALDVLAEVTPDRDWRRVVMQMDYKSLREIEYEHVAAALAKAADASRGDIITPEFASIRWGAAED